VTTSKASGAHFGTSGSSSSSSHLSRNVLVDKLLSLLLTSIGTRVGSLVFESLDNLVETDSNESSKQRTNPVNPVVRVPITNDDSRTK